MPVTGATKRENYYFKGLLPSWHHFRFCLEVGGAQEINKQVANIQMNTMSAMTGQDCYMEINEANQFSLIKTARIKTEIIHSFGGGGGK